MEIEDGVYPFFYDQVIALDRVQKGQPLTDEQFKLLKRHKLIEGRRPNLFVAATVAGAAGQQAAYIRNRGLDKSHYKQLILEYLRRYQQASPVKFEELLLDKLPDVLTFEQRKRKIQNLLQEMARNDQSIRNVGGRGKAAVWRLF